MPARSAICVTVTASYPCSAYSSNAAFRSRSAVPGSHLATTHSNHVSVCHHVLASVMTH